MGESLPIKCHEGGYIGFCEEVFSIERREPGDCMHLPSNVISSRVIFFLLLYMLSQAAKRVKVLVNVLLMPSAVATKEGSNFSAVSITALHRVSMFFG